MTRSWISTLCTTAFLLSLSVGAAAEMSKSTAAKRAKAQHGGKVLSVEKASANKGKAAYKVKLLLDKGRVKTVIVSE